MQQKLARVDGTLQRFDPSPASSHGFARIGENLVHLPTSNRGVLEGNEIRPCRDATERYQPIPPETPIVADLNLDANGQNPFPVMWAHKPPQTHRRRRKP